MKSTLSKTSAWVLAVLGVAVITSRTGQAQESTGLPERIASLSQAVDRVQAQIDASQRELAELRRQLALLTGKKRPETDSAPEENAAAKDLSAAVAALGETQSLQQTQIATLQQSKVESDSKYPVKLNGLILFSGIVNTSRVDSSQMPTTALGGGGATGATLRQTTVGIDARGPHVFGAESRAAVRMDFGASAGGNGYGGNSLGVLRLRTASAELAWQRTRVFFALDRPLISPENPTSLVAVSTPALAWSGNLWAWNPEAGIEHDWLRQRATHLRAQLAVIDTSDPPALYPAGQTSGYTPPGSSELSRWPGVEGRVAVTRGDDSLRRDTRTMELGLGGHYAPHRTTGGSTFDSWAVAGDVHLSLSRYGVLTASAYRGQALGGLGAGAYKDYVGRYQSGDFYYRALDDMGGWLQLKQRAGQRLEFNEAIGIDNVPASQLRPYAIAAPVNLYNLARNRTATGNVIYSPSAYFVFSLEYRHIASSYVTNPTLISDVIGMAAGYRF